MFSVCTFTFKFPYLFGAILCKSHLDLRNADTWTWVPMLPRLPAVMAVYRKMRHSGFEKTIDKTTCYCFKSIYLITKSVASYIFGVLLYVFSDCSMARKSHAILNSTVLKEPKSSRLFLPFDQRASQSFTTASVSIWSLNETMKPTSFFRTNF